MKAVLVASPGFVKVGNIFYPLSCFILIQCISASVHAGIHPPGVGLETNPPRCRPGDPTWVSAWRSPWVWAWRLPLARPLNLPSRCGPGPPQARPLNFSPGSGPGDPPSQTLQAPPWVWVWKPARHAGIHTPPLETCKVCWDTTCKACWDIPPHEQNHTDVLKHNLAPTLSFKIVICFHPIGSIL